VPNLSTIPDAAERLSGVIKSNLDKVVSKRLNRDYDFVLLIVGKVGDGKSCLAALACAYISSITGVPFTVDNIFWTARGYKVKQRYLKRKSCLHFDEGEEIFYSKTAMKREQRDMVLRFAQIRQQNHFMVICVPSLLLLEKWLRGIGTETRVNCIWRILRRGKFLCYSGKTGKLQRIKIDREANRVRYPGADFLAFWKPIPKKSGFWTEYTEGKRTFLLGKEPREDVVDERIRRMADSYTLRGLAKACGVTKRTARNWYDNGKIPKKYVFKDAVGRIRVDKEAIEVIKS